MSKTLAYLEMTAISERDRPDSDIVQCPWCIGTGKSKDGRDEAVGRSCWQCYGMGTLTMRRKRAMENGKPGEDY